MATLLLVFSQREPAHRELEWQDKGKTNELMSSLLPIPEQELHQSIGSRWHWGSSETHSEYLLKKSQQVFQCLGGAQATVQHSFFSPCAAQQGLLLVVAKALENLKFIVGVHWPSASAAFLHFSRPARPQHRNYLSSRWTRSNFLLNELGKHIVHPKYLARTVQCMYIKTISNFRTQKEMLALAAVQKEL